MKLSTCRFAGVMTANVLIACSAGQVRYVNAAAPAGGNGTSWQTAFSSLAVALDAPGQYSEVWVARGTYLPKVRFESDGFVALDSFRLRSNVRVVGGFRGTETSAAQADPASNPTTLSGDRLNNDAAGQYTDNAYRVVIIPTAVTGATLEGFTISGGFARPFSDPFQDNNGGGLWTSGGSAKLSRCRFVNNQAANGLFDRCSGGSPVVFPAGNGGAVAALNGSRLVFENCDFVNNRAGNGTGSAGCTSRSSSGQFGGIGGAVWLTASSADFIGCTFAQNRAGNGGPYGGAGPGSTPERAGSGGGGGAIACAGEVDVRLVNCTFTGNIAGMGGDTFSANFTPPTPGNGGSGGAIHCSSGMLRVMNCTFHANQAGERGVQQLPISFNPSTAGKGGGLFSAGTTRVVNCVFSANAAPNQTGPVAHMALDGATVLDSCIIPSGAPAGSNVVASRIFALDALFADPLGSDGQPGTIDDHLRLRFNSPGIDAGNTAEYLAFPIAPAFDAAGASRRTDAPATDVGVGPAPVIDIGAFEYQLCPGDFNFNGTVSVQDVFDFLSAFFLNDPRSDVDGQVGINVGDVLTFVQRWFRPCT
jgi:hypothetical protein